jgi:AcrR family transcriptional regulator
LARRSDHTRDELAELITLTATQIIRDDGLQSLSTREIAAKIGYSAGSIYNVFTNLDAVTTFVNANTLRALSEQLSGVKLSGDVLADARSLLYSAMEFQAEHPKLWVALVQHASRADFNPTDYFTVQLEAAFTTVELAIAPLFETQDEDRSRLAVRVIWASLQGMASVPANAPIKVQGGETTASLSINLVENYLRGIQARDEQ